ncbi:MAG TPA: phosphoribosylglycinamide formyltransferase [Firmicutes bacterium]|nr:phosphoribosylglycinamide formyltransferase [Bacillota bacterium]
MLNIVVLVSGGGTNLQALLDAEEAEKIRGGRITQVISSSPEAYALERAARHGVPGTVINRKAYANAAEFDAALLKELKRAEADLIVLAGFLCILGEEIVRAYANRIINVHPSLIPAFCGKGFYGLRVHRAALDYGVKVTGATVHFVNEIPDGGAIILQKAVAVQPQDTPETLQLRVMRQAEWELLPQAVSLFCEGRIRIQGNKAVVDADGLTETPQKAGV